MATDRKAVLIQFPSSQAFFYAFYRKGTVSMTLWHRDSVSSWQTDEHIPAFTDVADNSFSTVSKEQSSHSNAKDEALSRSLASTILVHSRIVILSYMHCTNVSNNALIYNGIPSNFVQTVVTRLFFPPPRKRAWF